MYRYSRNANADNLSSFSLPPQLVDPSLRGGDGLFPNLRVGKFGSEALAEDLTPYRVAKMFRPDVINMNASNPRLAKATNDIQFQKAGQSPGQAKALGELIRKDPALASSFNVGYGSTLNKEQGLAQKQGQVYEFDPSNEMWKSGFRRKNPDIVAMGDLQDALKTMPSGSRLTTYDGRPLDPSFTKAYYNLEATQDINDPQLFFNLKGKSDVDYGRIAQALNSILLDKTKKTDYSLAKRWERVQNYSPYPPRGATYVNNADKPYQNIDEIMADVNQVEVSRSPRMADSRIARSQNSGNSDNNNIPKDFTRREYLEATGDSDPLPPVDYSGSKTLIKLSDWEYADRNGYPMHVNDVGRAMDNPSTTVEDRSFILNQPQQQRPTTRLGTQRTEPFSNPYRQALPQGEIELPNGMVVNQYDSIKTPELARMAWAEESALNPNTSKRIKGLDAYYRVAGQNFTAGEKEGLHSSFFTPEVILPSSLAGKYQRYTGNMGYSPNTYRKATLEGRDVNELDITKLSRREAAQLKDVGFYEFNDIMDEGVRTSKDIDRLYGLNDELAELSEIARSDDMYADILGYEQSNVMDKIVEAERKQQDMGGTYRALTGTQDQGAFEQERIAFEGSPSALTQYNVNEVLEPSFGRDYSGRANTGRIRVPSGIDYDAGIPVPTSRTRIATQSMAPIKLQDDVIEPFNVAQYNRDLLERGSIFIDTQLGIPIAKAPTTAYDPVLGKNISYAQTVRPSRVIDNPLPWGPTDNTANWQAPESLAIGRVGKQIAVENIPELPTNTGVRMSTPQALGDIYGPLTPMRIATLPSREMIDTQGQVLYPDSGIGPINTGLKPKATIGELFGFSALTPEGLDKYKDMTLRY